MPIYVFKCPECGHVFEEIWRVTLCDFKVSMCPKCDMYAKKIPAPVVFNKFKAKKFNDGTETPEFISTPRQEKAWLKSEGITLDAPSSDIKMKLKKEREVKTRKAMDDAFLDASKKCEQGFKIEGVKQREVKGELTKLT